MKMTKLEELANMPFVEMRDATPEELQSVNGYIKEISVPTGKSFWDYLLVHQKVPVTLKVENVKKHQPNFDLEEIDENTSDI